jgi:hypothetical protein
MKLYFYKLNTGGRYEKTGITVQVCEAEEKSKIYKSVDRFFPNYCCAEKKDDVGRIINFNYLFLTEPNFEYAKEVFRNGAERRIANKLEEIEKLKAELKIINESEEN